MISSIRSLFKNKREDHQVLSAEVLENQETAMCNPEEVENWGTVLQEVADTLQTLAQNSEGEFLELGNHMQMIASQANEIAQITFEAANFLTGSEIIGSIEELQEILERIDRYFQFYGTQTEQDIENLKNIRNLVYAINEPLSGFSRLVKRLRILAMSTRIENARLNMKNSKFENLVYDVTKLSEIIDNKANAIGAGAKELATLTGQRLESIVFLKEKQYKQAIEAIKGLQNCLNTLLETHSQSSETVEFISDISRSVSKEIGEVVVALQFHDITRQKIEHVAESVADAHRLILAEPQPIQQGQPIVQQVNSILSLQLNQLNSSETEFSTAIQEIMNGLSDISVNVLNMVQLGQELTVGVGKDRQGVTQRVATGIEHVKENLFANLRATVELAEEMRGVSIKLHEMDDFVDEINQVGTEIELIALNGLIHAAHLGQDGAGLSVLADSIQKLSLDAHTQIANVSRSLEGIVHSTKGKQYKTAVQGIDEGVQGVVQEIVDELGGFVDSLNQVTGKVKDNLNQINTLSEPFANSMKEYVDSITVHHIVEKSILDSINQLTYVLDEMRPFLTTLSKEDVKKHLEGLETQYTMNSERDLHQMYVDESAITPFNETVPQLNESGETHWNENVELF